MTRLPLPPRLRGFFLLLPVLLFFGCRDGALPTALPLDGPVYGKTSGSVTITQVSPSSGSVALGETLQFVALDANGQPVSAKWSSSDTTIARVSSTGLATGRATGSAVIQARSGKSSASATITVTSSTTTVPVASVEVNPASDTITVGGTVQLTATTKDANGNILTSRTITWVSSDSAIVTVDGSGFVTGMAAGSAQVMATSEGKSDTAVIAVESTISPPPPSVLVNECASPKSGWIWCDDFEEDRLASYFEHDSNNGDFVRASTVGVEGSSAMRAGWQKDQVGAGWMHVAFGRTPSSYMRPVDSGTQNYREIYWRFYLKNQPGWIGGGGHKISRAKVFAKSDWTEAMQALVWSSSKNVNHLILDPVSYTDTEGNLTGTARWLGSREGATPVFDADHVGQWHCIEAHVRLNDAGQDNGVFELWLNGATEITRTGLNWVGAYDEYGINTVTLDNYWNGGAPQAQERYFDNLVVSTERIGC